MVNVFIAEDQELVRVGLKAALTRNTGVHIVGEADNGLSAVEQVVASKPSVVLVDLDLPAQSGIETTRSIKEKCPATRVVIFTGCTDDNNVFRAIEAGADAYVVKSSDMQKLLGAIQAVLQGAVWLDPAIALRVMRASTSGYNRQEDENSEPRSLDILSEREQEIVRLVAAGLSNQKIAKTLFVSIDTVKTHVRHIMAKMGVNNRTEAAVKAIKLGLFV